MEENIHTRYNILHVDDNLQFLKLFSVMFKRHFEITSVENGEKAMELLKDDKCFHAVISDYDLPGISGIDLLKWIKERKSDLPVVFYTGQGNEDVARNAFLLGAADYIKKEIGGLAQVEKIVNSVAKAVESNTLKTDKDFALQELKKHKDSLEETVKERTREIVELNKKLQAEIEERKKIEDELIARNRTLDNIFENNPYPMCIFDIDGHLIRLNSAIIKTADGVVPPPDYVLWEDPVHLENGYGPFFDELRKGRTVTFPEASFDLQALDPTLPPSPKYKSAIGFPLLNEKGEIRSFLFMQEERTERRLAEQALERANEDLRKLNDELEVKVKTRVACIEESNAAFRQEIEMRKQAEQDLNRQKALLSAIISDACEGIIATDTKGNVVFLNPEAEKLTGWKTEEVLGVSVRSVFEIVDELTGRENLNPVFKAIADGKKSVLTDSIILVSKDGRRIPIDDCSASLWNDNGKLSGVVLVFRDITQKRAVLRELESKNRELQDFAYVVSHDLKTPLCTLYGFMEVIENDPSTFMENFPHVKNVLARMEKFISNMLKLCSAGKIISEDRVKQLRTGKLLTSLFGFIKPVDCEAELILKEGIPDIYGDSQRLEEAFMNIMSNSIKNRDPENGKIIITVEGSVSEGRAVLSFHDNGNGIKPEIINKIFLPGFTATRGGTGFGLPIVKKIIEAHGGKVSVSSEGEGKGAVFTVDLPV
ncbi:MAG: ATP-binding protein [Firmicutes bacterium]|nr:ATP-binding protein [Bacillota bacterium]